MPQNLYDSLIKMTAKIVTKIDDDTVTRRFSPKILRPQTFLNRLVIWSWYGYLEPPLHLTTFPDLVYGDLLSLDPGIWSPTFLYLGIPHTTITISGLTE